MNRLMLEASLEVFATIANLKNEQVRQLTESYVEIYLSRLLSPRIAKQKKEEFTKILLEIKKDPSVVNINRTCRNINKELSKGQRVLLLVNFIEFVHFTEKNAYQTSTTDQPLYDFIEEISQNLSISKKTLQNCKSFVTDQYHSIPDQEKLVYAKENNPGFNRPGFLSVSEIKGFLVFFYIEEADIVLFKYNGSSVLELNSRLIFPKNIYTFQSGSVISFSKKPIIYYSQIIKFINKLDINEGIKLKLRNVEFRHRDSSFGLKNISIECISGELIGIMGGSGSGKTTLLNIISGNLCPEKGEIELNGINYSQNIQATQKYIGFVPQDDSLIGELTVFENLYYTTSLSSSDLSQTEIESIVENKLSEFSLYNIRNQRVGLPVKRKISGGQRKRLNIISELVREPHILLVDEPTSGLSSSDSYRILISLKEQASKGKLVIINIHQPSSEIFRLFDKILVLDQGGYMVFYGNPIEAIDYFKEQSENVDNSSVECVTCHNLKPDEIFDIIEEKEVDESGEVTDIRKRKPEEWSQIFNSKLIRDTNNVEKRLILPEISHGRPSRQRQFTTYFERFVLRKIRDFEFILYSISIPLLLALIVSFFCKYYTLTSEGRHIYTYCENDNIPVFFLMSFIACFFTGIIVTADCIIRDSLIRKREKLLFLSQLPYLNSKIAFFSGLSILQSIVFTSISVLILQIPGSILQFWIVLFIASIIGNITGIILSALIKSTAAAYIVIPFLIIPQIIFSGIAIPFHKLNYQIAKSENVPLIGNITFARWGIEALLVNQFKDNQYEKHFFELDVKESQTRIKAYFLIPELNRLINDYKSSLSDEVRDYNKLLINDGVCKLGLPNTYLIKDQNSINLEQLSQKLLEIRNNLMRENSLIINRRNNIINTLAKQVGSMNALINFKNEQTNMGVERFVLNRHATAVFEFSEDGIVQNVDPIFAEPNSDLLNAHFFTHKKMIYGYGFDTYIVNVFILLMVFFSLYFSLIVICRIRDI